MLLRPKNKWGNVRRNGSEWCNGSRNGRMVKWRDRWEWSNGRNGRNGGMKEWQNGEWSNGGNGGNEGRNGGKNDGKYQKE